MQKGKAKWGPKPTPASTGFWRDTPPQRHVPGARAPAGSSVSSQAPKDAQGLTGAANQRRFRLVRPSLAALSVLVLVSITAGVVLLGFKSCFSSSAMSAKFWLRRERGFFTFSEWPSEASRAPFTSRKSSSTRSSSDDETSSSETQGVIDLPLEVISESRIRAVSQIGERPDEDTETGDGTSAFGTSSRGMSADGMDLTAAMALDADYNESELFRAAIETDAQPYSMPQAPKSQSHSASSAALGIDPEQTAKDGGVNPIVRGFPKVAFMFLTRGPLPLAQVWARFLQSSAALLPLGGVEGNEGKEGKEGREELFSIYIHTAKEFHYMAGDLPDVFVGRCIPSEDIQWGGISMVDAERRLLAQALLDPLNQRFVLVSDSCIPLFNFSFVYNYLMNTDVSFVRGSNYRGFAGTGRWNRGFLPLVPVEKWRKGNQWFAMTREAARLVVSDAVYYPVFKRHCRSCPRARCHFSSCYSDEHYIQTFLYNVLDDSKLANRSVTWIDWSRRGAHPMSFMAWQIGAPVLSKVRARPHCTWNDKEVQFCYLFARKFKAETIHALLKWTEYLGY